MELGLGGRRAAIAASSMGLGFASALELAREGAHVAICSRSRERIGAAAERIRAAAPGVTVHPAVVDVSSESDCTRFVEETVEALGGIDILVTNTGGPRPGTMDEVEVDDFRDGVDNTLMSAIVMMKAAAEHMRARRWGRIINVVSMTVKQPKPSLIISNTMRPAIVGFAKSISQALAADNVTVNNIAPGYTRTERLTELAEHISKSSGRDMDSVFEQWEAEVPARRIGDPAEFAAAVAFLASERASFITGVTLQVDGGSTLGLL
jgi:3-oxoacyl-[acyl-carrier protein] reductase